MEKEGGRRIIETKGVASFMATEYSCDDSWLYSPSFVTIWIWFRARVAHEFSDAIKRGFEFLKSLKRLVFVIVKSSPRSSECGSPAVAGGFRKI